MSIGDLRKHPPDIALTARFTIRASDQMSQRRPLRHHPVRLGQRLTDQAPRPQGERAGHRGIGLDGGPHPRGGEEIGRAHV